MLISLYLGVKTVRVPLLFVVNCFLQHLQVYSFTCEVTFLETSYLCPKRSHFKLYEYEALVVFFMMVKFGTTNLGKKQDLNDKKYYFSIRRIIL